MQRSSKIALTFALPLVGWSMISCAHRPQPVEFAADTNPSAEIQQQDELMTQAKQRHVHLLAPSNFRKAEKALAEAKEEMEDKEDNKEVLEELGYARAYLNQANEVAARAEKQIMPVINARQNAIEAKADQLLPKQLAKVDGDLKDIGDDFEDSKTEVTEVDARDITELQERYVKVEESAIKADRLGVAYSAIEKAEKSRGNRVCPVNMEQTRIDIAGAEKVIETRRTDKPSVDAAVNRALLQSEKLAFVCEQAAMSGGRDAEPLAVKLYEQRVASGELKSSLTAAQGQIVNTKGQLEQANAAAASASSQAALLAAQQKKEAALKARMDAIRGQFSSDEAEVLQKGDDVILRLKKIQFSSSRAEIPRGAVPTLNKVRTAIGELGAEKVVVEGHTDSVGSEEVNMKVSQQRSEIVKDYLAGDEKLASENIEAVGKGFSEPLTSNKTKQGRAQNRRVDVVITPSQTL